MKGKQSKDLLEFDRTDRVGLRILLWATVGLAFGAQVLEPLSAWVRGRPIEVPFFSEVTVPALDKVGTGYGVADYLVTIDQPQALDHLLAVLPGIFLVALAVAGAVVVQRVMKAVSTGAPFAAAQVGRLRLLAALLAFGSVVHAFLALSCNGAILGRADLGGLSPALSFSFPWLPMVLGVVIAMIAEAFKAGARLQDDVEGLV